MDDEVELDSALRPIRERGASFKSLKTPGILTNKKQAFKKTFTKLKSNMHDQPEVTPKNEA